MTPEQRVARTRAIIEAIGWGLATLLGTALGIYFGLSAAFAEPRVAWGEGGGLPTVATLERCPAPADCWLVTVWPTLISVGSSRSSVALDLAGFGVVVLVDEGDGESADAFVVIPPGGWAAEPASVTVRDGEAGVVTLRPVPVG